MAEKVPIYPVEGTIWDTLRDYEIHHIKQTEAVQRATLGLGRDEALPRPPIDTPFPRMVYRESYFSEQAPDQKVKHYKLVQNEEEASKAAGEGFLHYGDVYRSFNEKEKARQEKEKAQKK
jgi:hypothetical protein